MVAIPWKFESSYPHHTLLYKLCMAVGFGVVAQLIERYVRIVEVVGLSPISSTIKSNATCCGIVAKVFGDMAEW